MSEWKGYQRKTVCKIKCVGYGSYVLLGVVVLTQCYFS